MFPFRNGSLPANALLIAIGAAAGVGMSVLVVPMASRKNSGDGEPPPHRQQAANRKSTDGSGKKSAPTSEPTENQDPQERAASLRAAGAEAARKDPASALALVGNFTSEQDKLEFLRGIYSVWAAFDPVSALDYAKSSLTAGLARSEAIGIAVNKWASKDPRAAWLWSEANLTGPLQEQAFTDVLIGWTRRSPADAARWLASTGYNSQPLLNAVASTWAERSPKDAYNWAKSLPNSESRITALIGPTREWLNQNPKEAIPIITAELSQPNRAPLATTFADVLGTNDPTSASGAVDSLPPGPAKDEAAATLAIVWAASDIKAAVAWSNSLSNEAMRRQVVTHIATTWGAIDPDAAIDWLHTLPGPLAADGVTGAFNSWAGTDAAGLREVVDGSPASPEMDVARLALADVLAATDISSSISLAFGISSPTGRDDAAARYFRQWRKFDDASAQEWLQQNWSTLDLSTQQRLTREQQRGVVTR
jgi:hypothetical protein